MTTRTIRLRCRVRADRAVSAGTGLAGAFSAELGADVLRLLSEERRAVLGRSLVLDGSTEEAPYRLSFGGAHGVPSGELVMPGAEQTPMAVAEALDDVLGKWEDRRDTLARAVTEALAKVREFPYALVEVGPAMLGYSPRDRVRPRPELAELLAMDPEHPVARSGRQGVEEAALVLRAAEVAELLAGAPRSLTIRQGTGTPGPAIVRAWVPAWAEKVPEVAEALPAAAAWAEAETARERTAWEEDERKKAEAAAAAEAKLRAEKDVLIVWARRQASDVDRGAEQGYDVLPAAWETLVGAVDDTILASGIETELLEGRYTLEAREAPREKALDVLDAAERELRALLELPEGWEVTRRTPAQADEDLDRPGVAVGPVCRATVAAGRHYTVVPVEVYCAGRRERALLRAE